MQRLFMHRRCLAVRARCRRRVARAGAQTAAAPTHKHYDKPAGYDQAAGARHAARAAAAESRASTRFRSTTKSERAQLFINQGLNLAYGFNHAEAARAFAEAARLDPEAAMAYWGQALVLGPNINAPMNAGGRAEGAASWRRRRSR